MVDDLSDVYLDLALRNARMAMQIGSGVFGQAARMQIKS
jgi:hypothetical protein